MNSSPSRVKTYFKWIQDLLESDSRIISLKVQRERYSMGKGFIQISVQLKNKKRLEIFEYFSTSKGLENYRYQLMTADHKLIARWDTAPHHPKIKTHPYHLHHKNQVYASEKMSILNLLSLLSKYA